MNLPWKIMFPRVLTSPILSYTVAQSSSFNLNLSGNFPHICLVTRGSRCLATWWAVQLRESDFKVWQSGPWNGETCTEHGDVIPPARTSALCLIVHPYCRHAVHWTALEHPCTIRQKAVQSKRRDVKQYNRSTGKTFENIKAKGDGGVRK